MPGIFGIVAASNRSREALGRDSQAMVEALRHRNSYHVRVQLCDGVVMGRIGPSFLNPEEQPVKNEDGVLLIVFDGELFEPQPARRTLELEGHAFRGDADSEIVLHAFEQSGISGIAALPGAYAGFIWNSRTNQYHLFPVQILYLKPL